MQQLFIGSNKKNGREEKLKAYFKDESGEIKFKAAGLNIENLIQNIKFHMEKMEIECNQKNLKIQDGWRLDSNDKEIKTDSISEKYLLKIYRTFGFVLPKNQEAVAIA